MRKTLIAVAALGLTTGACSLQGPGGLGTYSALQPEAAVLTPAAAPRAGSAPLPAGFEEAPAQAAMPGDLKHPLSDASGGGIEPIASLNASAHARRLWETLRPGELTHTPTIMAQAGRGAGPAGTTSALPSAVTPAGDPKSYDREAAMQGLINGGRAAGKGICSGC